MLESILPVSTNHGDSVQKIPELSQGKYEDDYQVDNVSISTYQDDGESYSGDDCVVVAPEEHVPAHFESVSIVNSNDIHFGNKTVYKGPVTIKQFLYPNAEGDLKLTNVRSELGSIGNNVGLSAKELCAFDNLELVKDKRVVTNGVVPECKECKLGGSTVDYAPELSPFRKGLKWIKNTQNWKRRKLFIMILLLLALMIMSAVVLWRYVTVPKNSVEYMVQGDHTNEEDTNTPVDYDPDTTAINSKVRLVSRLSWLAQPPAGPLDPLKLPVSLVIIQHTATESCTSQAKCIFQTRHIQTFHIESNGWNDIAYNFLLGGDGDAYEGRGWKYEGAHTFGYNNKSIGMAFIGTFNTQVPPASQISAFKKLVAQGVTLGHINKDYKIIAARQLSTTESPGKTFFEEEIKKWPHWSEKP